MKRGRPTRCAKSGLQDEKQVGRISAPEPEPLLAPDEDTEFPAEHLTVQSEDYAKRRFPGQDITKKNHFRNLGLRQSSESSGIRPRAGVLLRPLPARIAVMKTGALPFSNVSVLQMAERAGKWMSASDVMSFTRQTEIQAARTIMWPDLKFRSRVMTQTSEIPESDAVFSDLKWVSKRKRVTEIERKRKAEAEEAEQDRVEKRKKLLTKLKEYPERELRGMFPTLNQQAIVEVEKVHVSRCFRCHLNVYQVDERTIHTCRAHDPSP